jgi:hypothetical protein
MTNETEFASRHKLIKLIGATSRIKTSGVFKTRIEEIAHLEVFLVTCVSNDKNSPDYDSDYPIEGTLFELVSGNETKPFDFASELKSFITKHLEDHKARPSASILFS